MTDSPVYFIPDLESVNAGRAAGIRVVHSPAGVFNAEDADAARDSAACIVVAKSDVGAAQALQLRDALIPVAASVMVQEPRGVAQTVAEHRDGLGGLGNIDLADLERRAGDRYRPPSPNGKHPQAHPDQAADRSQSGGSFQSQMRDLDNEVHAGDLPVIQINDRALTDVSHHAIEALAAANDPPTVFHHGTTITRVAVSDDGHASLETLSRSMLRYHLERAALWRRGTTRKDELRLVAVAPPYDVVDDILASPTWPLPRIDRVVACPTFAPDGTLQHEAGYHRRTAVWHQPGGPIEAAVAQHPSDEQISDARRFICDELLGDFPFVSPAEQAHAVALLLIPFIRDLIDGPTPLHLIEAPAAGNGKGLLAQVTLKAGLGRLPATEVAAGDDSEWRKKITSVLLRGSAAVLVDNITGPLDSGALAAALTTSTWEDRLLGQNRTVVLPVRCIWTATANNPVLSTEIARRCVRIRLDAETERPWLRDGFRHPDLSCWADTHRSQIVGAALTLTQAWLDAGRPQTTAKIGTYENWSRVIGGILAVAGIDGFLTNLDEFYETADTESQALTAFIAAWWQHHQDRAVGAADLWIIAGKTQPALPIGDGTERSQRIRFGRWLGAQRDRIVNRYRIRHAGEYQGAQQWRLDHTAAPQ